MISLFSMGSSQNAQLAENAKIYTKDQIKEIVLDTLCYYNNEFLPKLDACVQRILTLCKDPTTTMNKIILECANFENSDIVRKFRLKNSKMQDALIDDSDRVFGMVNTHIFMLASFSASMIEMSKDTKDISIELFLFETNTRI